VARLFRFLEKKRGQRRTGSNLMGSVGEALFCGALFLLGVLSLTAVLASYLLDPDPAAFTFGVGRWLGILAMASFVIIGGGGLIWTVLRVGTSAERLGAMARQASEIDLGSETPRRSRHFPTIPHVDGLTNSPGIELAYRLPPSQSPGWRLFATTIFSWSWTSVTAVLTVWAVTSHAKERPEWLLTALLLPLVAVAIWSLRMWIRQIWIDTGMGPTTIEISECPLVPGHEYQVVLAQHGHIHVKSLELWLVCEEEATYRQGTDIRTESRRVYEHRIATFGNFRIEPVEPFQTTESIAIPSTAMHSFHSTHNSVHWRLLVCGEVSGWPPFTRGFPVVVHPGETTSRAAASLPVSRSALRPHVSVPPAISGTSV
jgi:hypothetical protein